jgi:hypothetical protein
MSFQEWLTSVQLEMVKHISTKNISLLCDLDKRIQIVKEGKFSYWKCQDTKYESDLHSTSVYRYLNELEDGKIYTFIPFISVNNRPDEPYIILSQQILVTRKSSSQIIALYLNRKIKTAINLYDIHNLEGFYVTFKYKEIDIKWDSFKEFK